MFLLFRKHKNMTSNHCLFILSRHTFHRTLQLDECIFADPALEQAAIFEKFLNYTIRDGSLVDVKANNELFFELVEDWTEGKFIKCSLN